MIACFFTPKFYTFAFQKIKIMISNEQVKDLVERQDALRRHL